MAHSAATAVSSRGGKTISSAAQQQHATTGATGATQFEIELKPPKGYTAQVVPPQAPRGSPTFYGGFRGGGSSNRAVVSGAAAAAMRQNHNQQEFQEPEPRVSAGMMMMMPMDEAFGRQFHPPADIKGESSLISGLSGGQSAVSGMSGISGLTDSAVMGESNSGGNNSINRAAQQAQRLDQVRHHWASPVAATAASASDNIPMLNASTGMGSSLNHSSVFLQPQQQQQRPSTGGMQDDSMSWTGHSLAGGGFTTRDDSSVMYGSQLSGSGGVFSISAMSAAMREQEYLQQQQQQHMHLQQQQQQQHTESIPAAAAAMPPQYPQSNRRHGGQQRAMPRYYYHNHTGMHNPHQQLGNSSAHDGASVASMSIASNGSLPSMPGSILSELSDTMNALDLAANNSGSGRYIGGGGSLLGGEPV